MPTETESGRWTGWWEGVVDLVPLQGGSRAFSIQSLFKKDLPKPFPEAKGSTLKMIMPDQGGLRIDREPDRTSSRWLDGRKRQVAEWSLADVAGSNINFSWDNEGSFEYRRLRRPHIDPSSVVVSATSQHLPDRQCAARRRRRFRRSDREPRQRAPLRRI